MGYIYSNLTAVEGEQLKAAFEHALEMNRGQVTHAVACSAHAILCPGTRLWNGKRGSESYAAALTYLVHNGILKVEVASD